MPTVQWYRERAQPHRVVLAMKSDTTPPFFTFDLEGRGINTSMDAGSFHRAYQAEGTTTVAGGLTIPDADPVHHPAHYTTGRIEVLDFIEDQRFGYLDGQVVKYVSRYRHKGAPLQDLQKARFYLDRLIAAHAEVQ